jgi:hypothetical protein
MKSLVVGDFTFQDLHDSFASNGWEIDLPKREDSDELKSFWVTKPDFWWWWVKAPTSMEVLAFCSYSLADPQIPMLDLLEVANKLSAECMYSSTAVLDESERRFMTTITLVIPRWCFFSAIEDLIAKAEQEWHDAARQFDFASFCKKEGE